MDVYDIYKVGAKCEYLRQCSPNVWREAEIIDVSRKNGITVKTDTGHVSTHSVDHVRLVAPAINLPNTVCTPTDCGIPMSDSLSTPAAISGLYPPLARFT